MLKNIYMDVNMKDGQDVFGDVASGDGRDTLVQPSHRDFISFVQR